MRPRYKSMGTRDSTEKASAMAAVLLRAGSSDLNDLIVTRSYLVTPW